MKKNQKWSFYGINFLCVRICERHEYYYGLFGLIQFELEVAYLKVNEYNYLVNLRKGCVIVNNTYNSQNVVQ